MSVETTTNDVIRKVTDIVTIVFPALVAVFGVLGLTDIIPQVEMVYGIVLTVLGSAASVASIIYNAVTEVKAKL